VLYWWGCGRGLRGRVGLWSRSMGLMSMISRWEDECRRDDGGCGCGFVDAGFEVSFWISRGIRLEYTVFSRFTRLRCDPFVYCKHISCGKNLYQWSACLYDMSRSCSRWHKSQQTQLLLSRYFLPTVYRTLDQISNFGILHVSLP
jgi:hypothetical protein